MDRDGRCYELAGKAITEGIWGELGPFASSGMQMELVHGWPILQGGPMKGNRYGHAWVEIQFSPLMRLCWDPRSCSLIESELYYTAGEIESEHCARYNAEEARERLMATEHWGTWTESPYEGTVFRDEDYDAALQRKQEQRKRQLLKRRKLRKRKKKRGGRS